MSTGDFRQLNTKQMDTVMYQRSWYKKGSNCIETGAVCNCKTLSCSGPGGVGKSHVIWLVHSDTLKLLRLSGTFEPDDVLLTVPTGDDVLLTVPTGVAAFNINGMTLRSALLLGRSMMGFSLLTITS